MRSVDWDLVRKAVGQLADAQHEAMVAKGFWDNPDRNMGEMLCLAHTELSEALEEHRRGRPLNAIFLAEPGGKPEGFGVELADLFLRIFDLVGAYAIDLPTALQMKFEYNLRRPEKHGKKY